MTLAGGALFGATLALLLARYVASGWVAARLHAEPSILLRGIESEGWKFGGPVRLVPVLPSGVLDYPLGPTRVPLFQYVWASVVLLAAAISDIRGERPPQGGPDLCALPSPP